MSIEIKRKYLSYVINEHSIAVYRKDIQLVKLNINCSVKRHDSPSPDTDDPQYAFKADDGSFSWTGKSSLWDKKEYRIEITEDSFMFALKVSGTGFPGEVEYFCGSDYEFSRYFIPNPVGGKLALPQYHSPEQDGSIAMHYQTPPLLAFPFEFGPEGWLSLGLAPQPGEYNIEKFDYRFSPDGTFSLATDYLGYTEVKGSRELAGITGTFGADEYESLAGCAESLYEYYGCARKSWNDSPRWWYGPLFCGWTEQRAMNPADQFAAANQKNYTDMSRKLDELNLNPTTIIIDDKWMARYGEALPDPVKWPDLRAFTSAEHAKGRRVVLWFKTWNHEGLDADECVHWHCLPQGADPTSPKYRKRLKNTFHKLLSSDPGCYNCDGFKVDFANVMPRGPSLHSHGGIYGIELLKAYMKLIYDTAKSVKPDCLINNSCSHPYFAEVTDQCRLHDYAGTQRSAWKIMSYRCKLYQAAMPGVPIDTDTVRSTYRETLHYIENCGKLGAPDLYFLSGNAKVPFDDKLHAALKRSWNDYIRSLEKKS